MATVVDAARPDQALVERAMDTFTQPTPRENDYNQSFDIYQSVAETVVPGLSVSQTPVNNTGDLNAPQVDYETAPFWLTSTPATERFT